VSFTYRGVIPILPTPFSEDEDLDLESLGRLLAFLPTISAAGATVLGVLGEANALTDAEARAVLDAAVATAGSLPIVAGASRYGVRCTRSFVELAAEAGASAVMIAPPSIENMSESAVYAFFKGVCVDSPLPIVVQDHPASTKVQMPTDLLVRIVDDFESVAGIKAEAVPTAAKVRALKTRASRVPVLTGLGGLYALFDLEAGSDGFNTGFAFPEFLVELLRLAKAGAWGDAKNLYMRYLPLVVLEQQPGPAVRKEVWRRRGILTSARVRAPGNQYDRGTDSILGQLLEHLPTDVRLISSNFR